MNDNKGGVVIDVLALGYLAVLLPGDIPINTFTMLIGLACAGRLIYRFIQWIHS